MTMKNALKLPAQTKGKKRPLSVSHSSDGLKQPLCSVCQQTPAVIEVEMPKRPSESLPSKKLLCLLHYYTTRAVRMDKVSVKNKEILETQLEDSNLQELFAEAYTELQQELAHEAAASFQKQQSDPLSILHSLHGKPKRKKPPLAAKRKPNTQQDGGFLRHVPLPERLLRTQQDQAKLQEQQVARMTSPAGSSRRAPSANGEEMAIASFNDSTPPLANPYQRRKSSRKSIWNLAMSSDVKSVHVDTSADTGINNTSPTSNTAIDNDVQCSCGSSNVVVSGSVTSRNSEMTKGETWGFKDRGDVNVVRYQCHSCGKTWNEEE